MKQELPAEQMAVNAAVESSPDSEVTTLKSSKSKQLNSEKPKVAIKLQTPEGGKH